MFVSLWGCVCMQCVCVCVLVLYIISALCECNKLHFRVFAVLSISLSSAWKKSLNFQTASYWSVYTGFPADFSLFATLASTEVHGHIYIFLLCWWPVHARDHDQNSSQFVYQTTGDWPLCCLPGLQVGPLLLPHPQHNPWVWPILPPWMITCHPQSQSAPFRAPPSGTHR